MVFHHSWLLKSLFLPRGIENGQSLQYGRAYQLDYTTKFNVNFLLAATVIDIRVFVLLCFVTCKVHFKQSVGAIAHKQLV